LGSICNRKAGADNGFALMVWASLYAAPPLILTSLLNDGPHRIGHALTHLHAGPVLGLLYVVGLSTFVGMGAWVVLITKYPASAVAPYTLGVPPIGILAAVIANGEQMTALEIVGSLIVLAGLVAIVVPRRSERPGSARRFPRPRIAADPSVPTATVEGTT
jgi:O-acetylserine/cysteine efflux transporter